MAKLLSFTSETYADNGSKQIVVNQEPQSHYNAIPIQDDSVVRGQH
jgi:hypothetical protein